MTELKAPRCLTELTDDELRKRLSELRDEMVPYEKRRAGTPCVFYETGHFTLICREASVQAVLDTRKSPQTVGPGG